MVCKSIKGKEVTITEMVVKCLEFHILKHMNRSDTLHNDYRVTTIHL
jgi:hypothetical protein